MPKNTITKDALAVALKELMDTKPFEKITVKDITDACNISRNTFYYHFTDKYDLLNWIFTSEVLTPVYALAESGLLGESFVDLCHRLRQDRAFYLEVFRHSGKNSLQDYLMNFYCTLLRDYMKRSYAQMSSSPSEKKLHLIARMQAHSYVGIVMDWIYAGMDDGYMCFLEQMDDFIRQTANYIAAPRCLLFVGTEKALA